MGVLDWIRSESSSSEDSNSHDVVQETERLEKSPIGSAQVSVTYRCTNCGEEHRRRDVFSDVCGDGNYNTGGHRTQDSFTALVQGSTNQYIKLLLILENDYNRTLLVTKHHSDYSPEQRNVIDNLREGEYIETYFVSTNAERTGWRFGKIVERNIHG